MARSNYKYEQFSRLRVYKITRIPRLNNALSGMKHQPL